MTDSNALKIDPRAGSYCQKIHSDQNEDVRIYGYERSCLRTTLTVIFYFATVGWLKLLYHWHPHWNLYSTHRKCPLSRATKILIIDDYQGKYKSYFVKDVKIVSSNNVSAKSMSSIARALDEELVNEIRGKHLEIHLENGTRKRVLEYRTFRCKKQSYIWDTEKNEFSKLVGIDRNILCADLQLGHDQGLSKIEQFLRRIVYGNNEIIVPVQNIGVLLLLEVLNPFYIFQVFSLCVWFAEGYMYYTAAIIFMSVFGISSTILQTRRNQINLSGTVASTENVRVRRDNGIVEAISSADLVPGDIIELSKHQSVVVCDAVLLTGNCIVNESMLTGESVPVLKTPLPSAHVLYDAKEGSHHTLFSGTTIIQTRSYGDGPVLARVIRTGLHTSKGSLVVAILYPPPADFKFDQDSYKFIGILTVIAICGCLYTIVSKLSRSITLSDIALKALDVITIVIPPALPAAMTVGKLYAQARLKRDQIYCINSRVINVSGSINCICFDKTGTLTEDGLDMWGVVPCTEANLEESVKDIPQIKYHPLFEGMLVCHTLTLIDDELCGDPLDVKMFESTGWILEEPDTSDTKKYDLLTPTIVKPPVNKSYTENMNEVSEIGIVHQYQFSSSLQRMSVIARVSGSDHFVAYTKGSPEMIMSLSKPESIPKDIASAIQSYTELGHRVIAMGRSIIDTSYAKVQKIPRNVIEKDLEFLGLVILENRLKAPTVTVIKELRDANMHVLMITGDNILTAVSVAKECGILSPEETVIDVTVVTKNEKSEPELHFTSQGIVKKTTKRENLSSLERIEYGTTGIKNYRFAVTGRTWELLREHFPDILPRICVRGAVFARMTSDQKQQLVVELMQLGYYVAMCGDGANDCGALRAAHAGISLSEGESSVASPFTSCTPDITCVPKVIQQGRAALVTSFGIFKFMVTYSLNEFLSVIILYSIDSNLTDFEFLFIDICLIVNFAFFFGRTAAYTKRLAEKPPMTSLLSFTPIFSLTVQMLIMAVFQVTVFYTVKRLPWFVPFDPNGNTGYSCYENYSVFCVSMFQYITMAIVFSRGKPYRKTIYSNYSFIVSILLFTLVCIYITLYPAEWLVQLLQLILPPVYDWRMIILAFAVVNFLVSFVVETYLIESLIEKRIKPKLYKPGKSKKAYLRIEYELRHDPTWPKLNGNMPVLPITPSIENIVGGFDLVKNDSVSNAVYDNVAFVDEEFGKNMTTKL